MDKLLELTELTKCTFILTLNEHNDFYERAQLYYATRGLDDMFLGEIDWTKPLFKLQVYPRTPVMFVMGISNNLDELVDWALAQVKDW